MSRLTRRADSLSPRLRRIIIRIRTAAIRILVSRGVRNKRLTSTCARSRQVIENQAPEILDLVDVLHEGLLVLLHQVLALLLANQHVLEIAQVELLGLAQPYCYFGVAVLLKEVGDEFVILSGKGNKSEKLVLLFGRRPRCRPRRTILLRLAVSFHVAALRWRTARRVL